MDLSELKIFWRQPCISDCCND